MKIKLIGTAAALAMILSIGYSPAMGGAGGAGGHGGMGGSGTLMDPAHLGHDPGSTTASPGEIASGIDHGPGNVYGQIHGETGHGQEVPPGGGASGNPQSRQGTGAPLSCH